MESFPFAVFLCTDGLGFPKTRSYLHIPPSPRKYQREACLQLPPGALLQDRHCSESEMRELELLAWAQNTQRPREVVFAATLLKIKISARKICDEPNIRISHKDRISLLQAPVWLCMAPLLILRKSWIFCSSQVFLDVCICFLT